jgi:hypothetical protein
MAKGIRRLLRDIGVPRLKPATIAEGFEGQTRLKVIVAMKIRKLLRDIVVPVSRDQSESI